MKNVQTLMITLVACLALAATAVAGNMRGMGPQDRYHQGRTANLGCYGPGMMGIACGLPFSHILRLDLTDAQRAEAMAVMEKYKDDQKALLDELISARQACTDAMKPDAAFDEDAIRQSHRAVAAVSEELAVLRGKIMADLKPILTWDQMEALTTGAMKPKGRAMSPRERMRPYCPMIDQWKVQDTSPAAGD
jgi:Spy/CpxP family protein refolding chaperone